MLLKECLKHNIGSGISMLLIPITLKQLFRYSKKGETVF